MHDSYNKKEFWESYSRFWFTSPENEGIANVANEVAGFINTPVTGHLNVLCLGVGIGTMEFPLLKGLRVFGNTVNVIGIDGSSGALDVASHLWEQTDWRRFSGSQSEINDEFTKIIQRSFGNGAASRNFFQADFDDDFVNAKSIFNDGEFGLSWCNHELIQNVVANGGFDLIFVSACLHHLNWWKSTLANSLRLMSRNGLVLLSQVAGDIRYVDRDITRPGKRPRNDFAATMAHFWTGVNLYSSSALRPTSGAIKPVHIVEMLKSLSVNELSSSISPRMEYRIDGSLRRSDVENLLRCQGFSGFRKASDEIGDEKYEKVVSEALASMPECETGIENTIRWRVFRSSGNGVNECFLAKKYFELKSLGNLSTSQSQSLDAYELAESRCVAFTSFNNLDVNESDFESCLAMLIASGVIPSNCVTGMIGRKLVQNSNLTSSLVFKNPYRREIHANKVMVGLLHYLAYWQQQQYSNTSHLLAELIPRVGRPIVLVMSREPESNERISVEVEEYSTHTALKLKIPDLSNQQKSLAEEIGWFTDAKSHIENSLSDFASTINPFVYSANKLAIDFPNYREFMSGLGIDIDTEAEKLQQDALNAHIPPEAITLFSDKLVATLRFITLTPTWTHIGAYPITFLNPKALKCEAMDAFLVLYTFDSSPKLGDEQLNDFFLNEFYKYSNVFDQLGARRSASIATDFGKSRTFSAFSHEERDVGTFILNKFLATDFNELFNTSGSGFARLTKTQNISECHLSRLGVVPSRDCIEFIRSQFFLWVGSPDLSSVFDGNDYPKCILKWAIRQAAGIETLRGFKKSSLEGWQAIEVFQQTWECKFRKNYARVNLKCDGDFWFSNPHDDSSQWFARGLVAMLTNSFKNAPTGRITLEQTHDGLGKTIFSVSNDANGGKVNNKTGTLGTKEIIEICVSELGETAELHWPNSGGNNWEVKLVIDSEIVACRED